MTTSPFRALCGALALAAAAQAQNDHDLDKLTSGALGSSLDLRVANAPASALLLVMPSFTAGPTPVAAVDPTDPRVLSVGSESSANWFAMVTNASGGATISLALPPNPAFQGVVLYWQTLTVPGTTTIVGEIGNPVTTQVSMPGGAVNAPASLAAARAFAVGFAAPSFPGGGDFVVAGGGSGTLTTAQGLASTEIWSFRRMNVRPGPSMGTARALHLSVPLADGRVLVLGGADAAGVVLASCEIYDPVANTFTPTASMGSPRILHAACRMADGRVLVAGGTTSLVDVLAAITSTSNTCEIWNPATGTWTAANNISGRRLGPALTPLSTGQVLLSGGVEVTLLFGFPTNAVSTTVCQRFNPATGTWSSAGAMAQGRAGHHFNQVTLADGRVLMTGGIFVPNLTGAQTATPTNGAELYNPTANTWAVANMGTPRALHTATRLADGRVVVCGGAQGTLTTPASIAGVEVFSPVTNAWSASTPLLSPRASHVAGLVPDGTLVLFGGQGAAATTATIETLRF